MMKRIGNLIPSYSDLGPHLIFVDPVADARELAELGREFGFDPQRRQATQISVQVLAIPGQGAPKRVTGFEGHLPQPYVLEKGVLRRRKDVPILEWAEHQVEPLARSESPIHATFGILPPPRRPEPAAAERPKVACALVPTFDHAGIPDPLSRREARLLPVAPFWAQELIGADLARDYLRDLKDTRAVPVGVMDSGVNPKALSPDRFCSDYRSVGQERSPHGSKVSNLILGAAPVGVSERACLQLSLPDAIGQNFRSNAAELAKSPARLINVSQRLGEPEGRANEARDREIFEAYQPLTRDKIFVLAAGNRYPWPPHRNEETLGAILVGSLGTEGMISDFSQESDQLTILAPSDRAVQSRDADGYLSFGGTSGAAPLVTGALANVLALLPDLGVDEAKLLLQRTALPTANARGSRRRNGAGTLNALKLVRVAERLRTACPGPQAADCRRRLTSDPANAVFDFRAEADRLLGQAREREKSSRCEDRQRALQMLRQAFLLGNSVAAREKVEQAYREQGYDSTARLWHSLAPGVIADVKRDVLADPDSFQTAARIGTLARVGALDELAELMAAPIPGVRALVIREVAKVGPPHDFDFVKRGLQDASATVRNRAAALLGHTEPERYLDFGENTLPFYGRLGDRRWELLALAALDPNPKVRASAATHATQDPVRAAEQLQALSADPNGEVREALLETIDPATPGSLAVILRTLTADYRELAPFDTTALHQGFRLTSRKLKQTQWEELFGAMLADPAAHASLRRTWGELASYPPEEFSLYQQVSLFKKMRGGPQKEELEKWRQLLAGSPQAEYLFAGDKEILKEPIRK